MELTEKLVLAVLAETVAQASAMFFAITKHFFPNRDGFNVESNKDRSRQPNDL